MAYHPTAEQPFCSFDEFWRAWESRTLVDLFARYCRDTWGRPSIWLLKHMLVLDETTHLSQFPHIREGVKEYGFHPRMDTRVKIELRELYKTTQKCDPLKVYEAKIKGNLDLYSWDILKTYSREVRGIVRAVVWN